MARSRPDYRIGERAAKEVWARMIQNSTSIRIEMGKINLERKAFYFWERELSTPSAVTLQHMAQEGYDVIYILTGIRSKTGTD